MGLRYWRCGACVVPGADDIGESSRMKHKHHLPCWRCGKNHPQALTPFPDEEGWPCPYDASKEALHERITLVVSDNPNMVERFSGMGNLEGSEA